MSEKKFSLESVDRALERWEEQFVNILTRAVTWLAPLVPAMLVYHSAQNITAVDAWLAGVWAAVIELLGLSVVSNWLSAREFNRLYAQNERERIGMAGHVVMVSFYILTVGSIVFGLKVDPRFSWVALMSATLLSLISAVAFVMRKQQTDRARERREEIERQRLEEERQREAERREREHALEMERRKREQMQALELERMQAEQQLQLEQMRRSVERTHPNGQRRLTGIERSQMAENSVRPERVAFGSNGVGRSEPNAGNVVPERQSERDRAVPEQQPERDVPSGRPERPDSKDKAKRLLLAFYGDRPDAPLSEAGDWIGRGKSTVSSYQDELEAEGKIVRHKDESGRTEWIEVV